MSTSENVVNLGYMMKENARIHPESVAVIQALPGRGRKRRYRKLFFRELDDYSDRLAAGFQQMGVKPGMRMVLLVRPGIDFVTLLFALFKAGAVTLFIDAGMGLGKMLQCLEEVEPDGFVGIPTVQAARQLYRRRFKKALFNVTAGTRWFWGGRTLNQLQKTPPTAFKPVATKAEDPAAIIFTTGSTGPPKGVLYLHDNFHAQVNQIRGFYQIRPDEIDLAGFPFFALYNGAMGIATVLPNMNFTRPAQVEPNNIVQAVLDCKATQAFGSPALWNVVGTYCQENGIRLPSLQRVLSAGAPVPPHVLESMKKTIHENGEVYTPYGATEALPVSSIAGDEVLTETVRKSVTGSGTCVGTRFSGIDWKVIGITDGPIEHIEKAEVLPHGKIGELIVKGPVVIREYVNRTGSYQLNIIRDGNSFWRRMGDVGYLDDRDRFWYCGRKGHRVQSPHGTLYTIQCETIVNQHPRVYRSALVGIGDPLQQKPVLIVELRPGHQTSEEDLAKIKAEILSITKAHAITKKIEEILFHPSLPVDIRHNAKIFREQLADWAVGKITI